MTRPSLAARLWTYQAERFPLGRTAPLLLAYSAAAVTVSAHLAHRPLPGPGAFAVAFWLAMTFFWQLRAADEVKDADTDRRYRPERPIPRGLVSLRLIAGLGIGAFVPAAAAALWLTPRLLMPVGVVWGWMALMTVEFFAPRRLHASPLLYLATHMAVMPLIALSLSACEWLSAASPPPAGLWTFLWMSFCNGLVVEFGRKTWAPEQERPGVETYSSSWGRRRAVLALALAEAGAMAGLAGYGVAVGRPLAVPLFGLAALALPLSALLAFARAPTAARQKRLDTACGLWLLVSNLVAAAVPFLPQVGP